MRETMREGKAANVTAAFGPSQNPPLSSPPEHQTMVILFCEDVAEGERKLLFQDPLSSVGSFYMGGCGCKRG